MRENVFGMVKTAAGVLLAMLAFAAAAAAAPTIAAHTSVAVFDAKAMRATANANGYCWVGSIASRRSDAYRCMVGNEIHDPCFMLGEHAVACPTDVAANTGLRIALTKPLPEPNAAAASNAWQMRLTSGALCNAATGTTVPGYPYYCAGNLVCSAPPAGEPKDAVFVKCASTEDGKIGKPGSYLVTTLYE